MGAKKLCAAGIVESAHVFTLTECRHYKWVRKSLLLPPSYTSCYACQCNLEELDTCFWGMGENPDVPLLFFFCSDDEAALYCESGSVKSCPMKDLQDLHESF